MKRRGFIFQDIVTRENILLAHQNASKGKSNYHIVKYVNNNLEKCITEIQDMLNNKTYQVSDYSKEIINDKGKVRELYKLPYFPDRIIQWAIMLQIKEDIEKRYVSCSYASIENKGVHNASMKLRSYLKEIPKGEEIYCFKMDISKYYPSIDTDILKRKLRKIFKDSDLLWLLDTIIDKVPEGGGLPIGSYLSQYLANLYLTPLDRFIIENKKNKRVVRYMDDIVIVNNSKEELFSLLEDTHNFVEKELNLKIKRNYQIFPVSKRGIDFCGFVHYRNHVTLRKRIKLSFIRKLQNVRDEDITYSLYCSFNSYKGWLNWCSGKNLEKKYFKPLEHTFDRFKNSYFSKERSKKKEDIVELLNIPSKKEKELIGSIKF